MFEAREDEEAVEETFFAFLDDVGITGWHKKQYINTVLSNYESTYKNAKTRLQSIKDDYKFNKWLEVIFKESHESFLAFEYEWAKGKKINTSVSLGIAFGNFMAGFEYGIASDKFSETIAGVENYIKDIADLLAKFGKIPGKFIKRRIMEIAEKHEQELQRNEIYGRMDFIGKLASHFP